jgi:AraC-like DNA-binding protein
MTQHGLQSGPRESTLSILCVRGLIAAVEQAGVPRADLLHAAQLDPAQLSDAKARMPFAQFSRLCELAMQLTGDPALGLHWAEREGAMNLAPVTHLLLYAQCLRNALDAVLKFEPLLSDERVFQVLESDDKVLIRCLPLRGASVTMQTFWAAIGMAGLFRLIRFFVPDVRPDRVAFAHAAPAYYAEYERFFGRQADFQQSFTEVVLDRALMDTPSRLQDDGFRNTLHAAAQRRAVHLAQPSSYSLRVREFLLRQQRPYGVDMKAVADSLGVSPRTLHRRLASEGTSYRAVETESLTTVATSLLHDQRRSIQETAYTMGFSTTSTFHRVFKSWTGMTPGEYLLSVALEPGVETSE